MKNRCHFDFAVYSTRHLIAPRNLPFQYHKRVQEAIEWGLFPGFYVSRSLLKTRKRVLKRSIRQTNMGETHPQGLIRITMDSLFPWYLVYFTPAISNILLAAIDMLES